MLKRSTSKILLCICMLMILGCYEPKEECLDALASNFSIDADAPCCCCCEYPSLVFSLQHRYGDEGFNLNQVYTNARDQTFIPLAITFYVSDVAMRLGDDWLSVDQTINLPTATGEVVEPDDVTVLRRQGFQFDIGEFKQAGQFSAVRFSVGLNEPEVSVSKDELPSDHALSSSNNDLLDAEMNYQKYHLELAIDSMVMDTVTIHDIATPSLLFEIPVTVEKTRGGELSIPLVIDYREWFDDIDWMQDSSAIIEEKISAGILRSIQFDP